MIFGDKIVLRRIERGDLWKLWQWHELDELYLFDRNGLSISFDEVTEKFKEYFSGTIDFIVEAESKPFGVCSLIKLVWKNRTCELVFKFYAFKY